MKGAVWLILGICQIESDSCNRRPEGVSCMYRFGMNRLKLVLLTLSTLLTLALTLAAADWEWQVPPGVPRPPVPADNPMSAAKVEFGRYLFYDKRMSVNAKTS